MNETVHSSVVEHDALALMLTLAAFALLITLSSASGGWSAVAIRLAVAAMSGA